MKKILSFLFLFALILLPKDASAAGLFAGPEKTIGEKEVVAENYYSASREFSHEGIVEGDLFTAGENIEVTGTTTEDFFAVGLNLDIEGLVQDDLRVVGNQVNLSNTTTGEAIVIGSSVVLSEDADIKKDLIVIGSLVELNGKIGEDVRIYSQNVQINAKIGGNAKIYTKDITINENTNIAGNLDYSAATEVQIPEGAQIGGEVSFSKSEFQEDSVSALFSQNIFQKIKNSANYSWLLSILINLVTSLILFGLFKKKIKKMSRYSVKNFGKESLKGLAIGIATPIIVIFLISTVLGAWFGLMIGVLYALLMILAKFGAGMVMGTMAGRIYTKKKNFSLTWNTVAIGVLLLALFQLIPFVGSVFTLLFGSVALGTLSHFLYKNIRNKSVKA